MANGGHFSFDSDISTPTIKHDLVMRKGWGKALPFSNSKIELLMACLTLNLNPFTIEKVRIALSLKTVETCLDGLNLAYTM